ncbi:RNA-binding protein 34 [Chrysoperla carnea]|uniref:RNA-binding protein 34 n=1 Tax=Chrysoperla carnea TaxID=189513 RepID=UPI001D065578|nr:RNA-binding protein 34 [Chrysoperla carnea]
MVSRQYKFGDLSLLLSDKQVETSAKVVETEFKLKSESTDLKTKSKKNKRKSNVSETNVEDQSHEENETELKLESTDLKTKSKKKKRKLNDSETNVEVESHEENETQVKRKKKKNKTDGIEETREETSVDEDKTDSNPIKSKKRKKIEAETESVENEIQDQNQTETNEGKSKIDPEKQAAINNRTIFVGNWPLKKEKKHLKRFFKKYGTIETVRFRSVPVGDIRIPKKVTAITKQFHPDRTSTNAYVQFADEASAKRALAANGSCVDEDEAKHHLRVTLSTTNGDHDPKKAIFLGNVHFQAEEDDLWKIFGDCGEIESVKIIRDQKTNLSKGMGYVNFKSTDGVELALKMDEVNIKDRPLRIKRVQVKPVKKVKKEKKQKMSLKHPVSNSTAYEMRKGKKKLKPFQGVKYTQKLKKGLKKKTSVKRLQKKKPVKK